MATLLKVLNNLADIKSAGGVALRVRTQGMAATGIRFSDSIESQNYLGVWSHIDTVGR
jgi:hypothetical protein